MRRAKETRRKKMKGSLIETRSLFKKMYTDER